MNAQEARELSNSKKRDFESVLEAIKSMANGGHNYATISTPHIKAPEEYQTKLVEMGYDVKLSAEYFSITW